MRPRSALPEWGFRIWEFPKIKVPYFGALIVRILLFGVLYEGSLFSETPIKGLGGAGAVAAVGPATLASAGQTLNIPKP